MSRETRQALRRERKRNDRAGLGLILFVLAAIVALVAVLLFLSH